MPDSDKGQVSNSAAEIYDAFFLPALFQEWPPRIVDLAHIGPGQDVLDVACGTGVLALAAAERVGADGSVIGLDINEGMLAVARSKAPQIEWRLAPAEALPFEDGRFDAVVSQFALMFFADQTAALREMYRVLKPDGRLAVAVWGALEDTPGYKAMAGLLDRLFGPEAAAGLQAPYNLGDTADLQILLDNAGITAGITTYEGTAHFPSIADWVYTDIKGWTLADMIDDAQYQTLLAAAEEELQPFVNEQGQVSFSAPAHIVTAVK